MTSVGVGPGAHLVIGITGTLGAGKGCVVEYLVNKCGFKWLSVRQYLIQQIVAEAKTKTTTMAAAVVVDDKAGFDRDLLRTFANEMREKHGPTYIVEQVMVVVVMMMMMMMMMMTRTCLSPLEKLID